MLMGKPKRKEYMSVSCQAVITTADATQNITISSNVSAALTENRQ